MKWCLKKNIKRRKKLDLNFKIYKTKSVLKTNIYQRQKLHSHVVFGLINTSLGITSHLRWYHSLHFEHSVMKFPGSFSTLKVCKIPFRRLQWCETLQYIIIPLEVLINTFWILGMLVSFWFMSWDIEPTCRPLHDIAIP